MNVVEQTAPNDFLCKVNQLFLRTRAYDERKRIQIHRASSGLRRDSGPGRYPRPCKTGGSRPRRIRRVEGFRQDRVAQAKDFRHSGRTAPRRYTDRQRALPARALDFRMNENSVHRLERRHSGLCDQEAQEDRLFNPEQDRRHGFLKGRRVRARPNLGQNRRGS